MKSIKYVLKCVEGFTLSLISKFYVFINTCLFVSSHLIREEVIVEVLHAKDFPSEKTEFLFPFTIQNSSKVRSFGDLHVLGIDLSGVTGKEEVANT